MHLYKTSKAIILKQGSNSFTVNENWDTLINRENLYEYLLQLSARERKMNEAECDELINEHLLPPIGNQEVWAAGVTYLRSREARMEESKDSGGAVCYQKVYEAEGPKFFLNTLPQRVAGHKQPVHIRRYSSWNVPEPELTLYIDSSGKIQAYTIGNDMSSRSIEGENPLYLPQAKIYEKSAAIGPCLYVSEKPIPAETNIRMSIHRSGQEVFNHSASLSRMKRSLNELAAYLFRECEFPTGCFLMTGTCIVPPNDFTLNKNDVVQIDIDGIGRLTNTIGIKK